MVPGLRLRQVRERLGLTYRDVERGSFELAARRGRPEFILRISRLADIENRAVVPGIHKLYTLASIYHLNPVEVCRWYGVPLDEFFQDAIQAQAPLTHLAAPPATLRVPLRFDPSFDPRRTEFFSRMVERWGQFEGSLAGAQSPYCYGFVGLEDHRMEPLLRPGSVVLIDPSAHRIEEGDWRSEFDRPMYFVDVRSGYRCGWFDVKRDTLFMHPHPLSRCAPESWRLPGEADVIGKVVGVVMRYSDSAGIPCEASPATRVHSSKTGF